MATLRRIPTLREHASRMGRINAVSSFAPLAFAGAGAYMARRRKDQKKGHALIGAVGGLGLGMAAHAMIGAGTGVYIASKMAHGVRF